MRFAGRAAIAALPFVLAMPAAARTRVVRSGGSIRDALASARPGDRIEVMPGVYHEGDAGDLNALTVTLDGIELVGRPRRGHPVVLENAGTQRFGVWVSPEDSAGSSAETDAEAPPCGTSGARLHGFAISGFTVRGFAEHGVHLACVDGFAITGNVSDGNEVYGLFPILSKHGVVGGNEATNTGSDAAIYVGQSDDVLVSRNRVHDSLLGIEVQNCRHVSVVSNETHDNTLGILVDVEEGHLVKTQESTFVGFNWVHDNNRANSAEPGSVIAVLPPGIGVLLVGGDGGRVENNTVRNNGFAGIGVVSLCLAFQLLGQPCTGLDVDPLPVDNRVVRNLVRGNGTVSLGIPPLDALRADLVWDGSGTGNCWRRNSFDTSVPPALPSCP